MIYHILKRAESGALLEVFFWTLYVKSFKKKEDLSLFKKIKIDQEKKIKDRIALCQLADHVRGIAFSTT